MILFLNKQLFPYYEILCGFIFPKYTLSNADEYNREMTRINDSIDKTLYMMPILESRDIVSYATRRSVLIELKEKIDELEAVNFYNELIKAAEAHMELMEVLYNGKA